MASTRTMKQQLSKKQFDVLTLLLERTATTKQIGLAVDTSKGTGTMLQSLYQQGLITYKGGTGVKPGMGRWTLTERGTQAAKEQI